MLLVLTLIAGPLVVWTSPHGLALLEIWGAPLGCALSACAQPSPVPPLFAQSLRQAHLLPPDLNRCHLFLFILRENGGVMHLVPSTSFSPLLRSLTHRPPDSGRSEFFPPIPVFNLSAYGNLLKAISPYSLSVSSFCPFRM